jgi:hypothetical protein
MSVIGWRPEPRPRKPRASTLSRPAQTHQTSAAIGVGQQNFDRVIDAAGPLHQPVARARPQAAPGIACRASRVRFAYPGYFSGHRIP